ncbi:MAG: endonuclease III [Clostridia bacterium]|nr:endonuclease III [Clostridia bacterium]
MDKKSVNEILLRLEERYPDAKPALEYSDPFELLVAVILSAQCTDERVNKVTRELFKRANTPEKIAEMQSGELEKYIFSCGLYKTKAEHIISAAKDICEKFGGKVPCDLENLRSLAGVGRKTANVVYSVAFGGNAIAVDTHVFRVSARIGLAAGKTPEQTEKMLMKVIPEEKWSKMHHCLIWHGRKVCSARNPACDKCTLENLCEYKDKRL